jgi:hypothetical protein
MRGSTPVGFKGEMMKATKEERDMENKLFGDMDEDEFIKKYPDQQSPFLSGTQWGIFGYVVGMSAPPGKYLITSRYWYLPSSTPIVFHNIRWIDSYKTAKLFFIKANNFLDYIDPLEDEGVFFLMKNRSIYKFLEEELFNINLDKIKGTKFLINSYKLLNEEKEEKYGK